MTQGKTSLPPLDYLLAFEAAAELQSFAGASKKLNISETAISRKVRLLEQHYAVPFFLRGHRSISITPQGVSFLSCIQPALQDLRDASRQIVAEHKNQPVTLAATNSVATLWLMPRLQRFNSQNKHVKIMLMASDQDEECLSEGVDLAILRGDGNWPGHEAKLLFGETVFPVCAPEYLKSNPDAHNLDRLQNVDLISVASAHSEWMTWAAWLQEVNASGLKTKQTASFNTHPLAIQAAVDGLGVTLGWGHLVDPLLESGKLVRPMGDISVRTKYGYYLLRSEKAIHFNERQIVEEWLTKVSAARLRYGR